MTNGWMIVCKHSPFFGSGLFIIMYCRSLNFFRIDRFSFCVKEIVGFCYVFYAIPFFLFSGGGYR
jgi:hypothetical protein